MLRSLAIENFKAFGSAQEIPLGPITLLFGANSSGKSSLLQSLLLLKQTLDEAEYPATALLPKGRLVDLGSFKELMYRHDTTAPLTIALGVQAVEGAVLASQRLSSGDAEARAERDFTLSLTFCEFPKIGVQLDSVALLPSTDREPIVTFKRVPPTAAEIRAEGAEKIGHMPPLLLHAVEVSREASLYRDDFLRLGGYRRKRVRQMRGIIETVDSLLASIAQSGTRRQQRELSLRALHDYYDLVKGESAQRRTRNIEAETRYCKRERDIMQRQHEWAAHYSIDDFIADQVAQHKKTLLTLTQFLPRRADASTMPVRARDDQGAAALGRARRTSSPPWPDLGLSGPPVFLPRLEAAVAAVRELLDSLVYLGPLREYPARHYIYSGRSVAEVGKSGGGMPDMLFSNRRLVPKVNEWMKHFQLGYRLELKKAKEREIDDVFVLRLVDVKSGVSVSPLDVGFGISQILPIVVQSLLAENRLICVEQPELHLHPRLQAEFGSLLAHVVNGKNPNQFLIETHSEHLILRLQRLIRKKLLRADQVKVLHVSRAKGGSLIRELRLDSEGRFLDRWPEGFFEEGFAERFLD